MAITQNGQFVTVQQHIIQEQRVHNPGASGELSWLLSAITLSTKIIASHVRRAGLIEGVLGAVGSTNVQGETVQKLDLLANDALKHTLGYRESVGVIASEEDNDPIVLKEASREDQYIVMFDPLDGSSNIDANVSVGTIFTIFKNLPEIDDTKASVMQPGRKQVAAGYVVYGSSTVLVYTTGHGVHMFTLDPAYGAYLLVREHVTMPQHAPQYSVNEAYLHQFPEPYQKYLHWAKDQDVQAGGGGCTSRYIGSLVADFHRILLKGGVFLYPPTLSHADGKLRLMYEANPLAFIAEQAGGAASDGANPILDRQPKNVHDRTPLVIGSTRNVDDVLRFVNG